MDTNNTNANHHRSRWLDAALPMLWGAIAALIVVMVTPLVLKQDAPPPAMQLATVDIAKIMQEFNERVLRNPDDPSAVAHAMEESAIAANQLDPLLKHLSTELHPGYVLIQPQALAYHGDAVPDFTDELRVLLFKRTGKFNKLDSMVADQGDSPAAAPVPVTTPEPAPTVAAEPVLPLNPTGADTAGSHHAEPSR